jgi:chromosome partitioning protein
MGLNNRFIMEENISKTLTIKQILLAEILGVSVSAISKKAQQLNIKLAEPENVRKGYLVSEVNPVGAHFLRNHTTINRKIHVFYNFKGGTGKTTLTYQLSLILYLMGFKILLIDLDSQAHLTNLLGCSDSFNYPTIYDVLIQGKEIKQVILEIFKGFDIVPSNLRLTKIEVPLSQKNRREEIMSRHISLLKDNYDFILIDTNPTISNLNINALFAADHINIVCETQPLSLNGLGVLIEELEEIYKEIGKPFNYSIWPNKYESRTVIAQEVLGALRADYGESVVSLVIRKCEEFNHSSKIKQPIFSFTNKKSPAFEDLKDFCQEFLKISTNDLGEERKGQ